MGNRNSMQEQFGAKSLFYYKWISVSTATSAESSISPESALFQSFSRKTPKTAYTFEYFPVFLFYLFF